MVGAAKELADEPPALLWQNIPAKTGLVVTCFTGCGGAKGSRCRRDCREIFIPFD